MPTSSAIFIGAILASIIFNLLFFFGWTYEYKRKEQCKIELDDRRGESKMLADSLQACNGKLLEIQKQYAKSARDLLAAQNQQKTLYERSRKIINSTSIPKGDECMATKELIQSYLPEATP